MPLEQLIKLQLQFKEKFVVPLVIEYYKQLDVAIESNSIKPYNYNAFALCGVKKCLLKKYGLTTYSKDYTNKK